MQLLIARHSQWPFLTGIGKWRHVWSVGVDFDSSGYLDNGFVTHLISLLALVLLFLVVSLRFLSFYSSSLVLLRHRAASCTLLSLPRNHITPSYIHHSLFVLLRAHLEGNAAQPLVPVWYHFVYLQCRISWRASVQKCLRSFLPRTFTRSRTLPLATKTRLKYVNHLVQAWFGSLATDRNCGIERHIHPKTANGRKNHKVDKSLLKITAPNDPELDHIYPVAPY